MRAARRLVNPYGITDRGNALTAFLVALAICAAAVALILLPRQNQPKQTLQAAPVPAAPAPLETTESKRAEEAAPMLPPAAPEPAPPVTVAEPKETLPDIAEIAQSPALWPKAVSLTQPLTIPIIVNGKAAGQAQVPANTTVRLVRVAGQQVEVEYLNQRLSVSYTMTDLVTRVAALAKSGAALPVGAPLAQSVAARPAATPPPAALPQVAAPRQSDRYRKMALEVMEDIQKKYWIRETGRYAKKPGSNEADTVWGAGVMFSAVVGAARHEPGRYKPVLGKFFEGLDGYWDTKAKVPGYEPAPTSGMGTTSTTTTTRGW